MSVSADGPREPRRSPEAIVRASRAAANRTAAEIETAARMLALVAGSVREERVRCVRQALAYNDYESALKMEIAIDRLLEDLRAA